MLREAKFGVNDHFALRAVQVSDEYLNGHTRVAEGSSGSWRAFQYEI